MNILEEYKQKVILAAILLGMVVLACFAVSLYCGMGALVAGLLTFGVFKWLAVSAPHPSGKNKTERSIDINVLPELQPSATLSSLAADKRLYIYSNQIKVLEERLEEEKTVVGLIFIDNYEEVVEDLEDSNIPLLSALIDRKLGSLASEIGGIVKKLEKDRYIFLLSQKALASIKAKKFEILNEIRGINIGNRIPVTLSIGIGVSKDSLDDAMKSAKAAIDLALGRGGDQVLIKNGEEYLFFGGKSGEVSHNARIRARIKADALSELMGESDSVMVMGHRRADLDCLGAAIGIYSIAKSMKKPCQIVMGIPSEGIKRLYDRLIAKPEYENLFISPEQAMKTIDNKTLVVVTDTHRQSMVECPPLLNITKNLVVFDHHRKSTDFIENAVLFYHEPSASSTSELVTEVLQYMGKKVRLTTDEADALLGGIIVDTKSFGQKAGANTFEAAAFLRRKGADPVRVKMLFQNDMEAFRAKAKAMEAAEIHTGGVAVSVCPLGTVKSSVTAAQAADELLNVIGVNASFVICQMDEIIYISARSLGDINVQVILEKLGGGGHRTMSGVQLEGITLKEAEEKVKEAVKVYFEEANDI